MEPEAPDVVAEKFKNSFPPPQNAVRPLGDGELCTEAGWLDGVG